MHFKKSDFHYSLPEQLIAQKPLDARTSSRLLCLDRFSGAVLDKQFVDVLDLIQPNDIMVLNNTQVIPARLFGHKSTGGKVEILIEQIIDDQHVSAHMRASKSAKTGSWIELDQGFRCQVQGRKGDLFLLEFPDSVNILACLAEIGHIPLPPYIQREDQAEDVQRYQTVFAQQPGAVAAPTAGLHFDTDLMQQLTAKAVKQTFLTLHVGSGTFQPVRTENLAEHVMHEEFYSVSEQNVAEIEAAKANGGRVIAVGTTAVRALESASQTGYLKAGQGQTDLFITPGYQFKSVDGLITNFHLPESTLLMLISAFAGYESVMKAYQHAVEQQYRFFSYGDAMFIS